MNQDPQAYRLTPAHVRAGLWECKNCESCNDEDNERGAPQLCWNCEAPRDD